MGVHEVYSPKDYYDSEKNSSNLNIQPIEAADSDTYKTVDQVESGREEGYKYVVGIEQGNTRTDTFKSVKGQDPASAYYANTQASAAAPPREDRICGMRKKLGIAVGVGVLIVLLALIVGLAVGLAHKNSAQKNMQQVNGTIPSTNSTSSPDTTTELMLNGTGITAVDRGTDSMLFYQYGDGRIVALTCTHKEDAFQTGGASDCGSPNNTGIGDAKMMSPLASTHTPTGTYLFYLNNASQIQGGIISAAGQYMPDTNLNSLGPQTHNESQLSATHSAEGGTSGTVKLYYQDTDNKIQEIFLVSDGSGWSSGFTLSEATTGSKIVAVAWEAWYQLKNNHPRQVYQVRVYFEQANNTFLENVWDRESGWSIGEAPQRQLQPQTGLAGLAWQEGNTTAVNIFSNDKLNELFQFQVTLPPSNTFGTLLDQEMVTNVSTPIAASYFLESNTTTAVNASMRVYFQQPGDKNQEAIGEVMWSDTFGDGKWKAGKGIALKSIS